MLLSLSSWCCRRCCCYNHLVFLFSLRVNSLRQISDLSNLTGSINIHSGTDSIRQLPKWKFSMCLTWFRFMFDWEKLQDDYLQKMVKKTVLKKLANIGCFLLSALHVYSQNPFKSTKIDRKNPFSNETTSFSTIFCSFILISFYFCVVEVGADGRDGDDRIEGCATHYTCVVNFSLFFYYIWMLKSGRMNKRTERTHKPEKQRQQ